MVSRWVLEKWRVSGCAQSELVAFVLTARGLGGKCLGDPRRGRRIWRKMMANPQVSVFLGR